MRFKLYSYRYLFEFEKTTSKIFLIDSANNLKKTKLMPNQPNITEIDNKLEPRSLCKNSGIKKNFLYFNLYS